MSLALRKNAQKVEPEASSVSAPVFQSSVLRRKLWQMVHRAQLSTGELAWRLGISDNYLRRTTLEPPSGVRFPAEWLVPLTRLTNNYAVLDYLCREADSLRVSGPRVRKLRKRDPQAVNEVTAMFNTAMGQLLSFWDSPTSGKREEVLDALYAAGCGIAAVRAAVQSFSAQEELF